MKFYQILKREKIMINTGKKVLKVEVEEDHKIFLISSLEEEVEEEAVDGREKEKMSNFRLNWISKTCIWEQQKN